MLPSFLSIRATRVAAFVLFAVVALIPAAQRAGALGQAQYVQFSAAPGSFTIVNANTTATIYVDPKDWPGVLRAANDLSNDIKDVTGKTPKVISGAKFTERNVIIIGTFGRSEIIDQLVAAHKIDVSAIRGKWESYFTQVVRKPLPGVDSALVICGSDKRGSIYAIYDLSGRIRPVALALLGRCACQETCRATREGGQVLSGRAFRQVSRHLFQR